jgi:hypothetical protein
MIAIAFVSEGRWLAACPFRCGGAEVARTDWFVCRECANAANGGRRIPLVWPAPEDVRAIEAALIVRPPLNRNWLPNESIGALLVENVMAGLYDRETGQVAGDIGADQMRVPALLAVAQLELTA